MHTPQLTETVPESGRIGILTFHRAYNYGAVLQAYALQQALAALGAASEIIDYVGRYGENAAGQPRLKRTLKERCKGLLREIWRKTKRRGFDRFMRRHMVVSRESYREAAELGTMDRAGKYDAYIAGSDQVWNADITKDDPAWLLSFTEEGRKRNAYAASIGSCTFDPAREAAFRRELSRFHVLTVREQSALAAYPFLRDCGAEVALDPTLLLTRADYATIASKRLVRRKYAFLYTVPAADQLRRYAADYCKEQGWLLIDVKKSARALLHAAPEDWLSFLLHAEMVFTNSFHGTAFSILLEKPFVTEVDSPKTQNVRSQDLLELIGLRWRDMNDDAFAPQSAIDYAAVRARLAAERERSYAYLKEIVLHE